MGKKKKKKFKKLKAKALKPYSVDFWSCEFEDPSISEVLELPSYITIEDISMNDDVKIEGTTVTIFGNVSTYDLKSQANQAYCRALMLWAEKKTEKYLESLV